MIMCGLSRKKIADKDKICSILNEVGLEPLNLKKVKKYCKIRKDNI